MLNSFIFSIKMLFKKRMNKMAHKNDHRAYQLGNTSSRKITEVKQH